MQSKKSPSADIERRRPSLFALGLLLSVGATLYAFEWKTPNPDSQTKVVSVDEIDIIDQMPPIVVHEAKPEPKQPKLGPPVAGNPTTIAVRMVDNNEDLPDPDDLGLDLLDLEEGPTGETEVVRIVIRDFVSQNPEFIGGEVARQEFLSRNIKYPANMRIAQKSGRVYARCVIWMDGSVRDVEILDAPHPSFAAEAKRVLETMPNWIPGRQDSVIVPVRVTMPINFKLGN